MMSSRRCLRLIAALSLPALAVGACGKDENLHPSQLLEFSHTLPLQPAPLEGPLDLPAWLSGHALAVDGDRLLAIDRDNGTLVTLDRATLDTVWAATVGERPEQVVVGPDGIALVTVRGTGEVVRVDSSGQVVNRAEVGVEALGLALSVDGRLAYVTLPSEDEFVVLDAETLQEQDRVPTLRRPRAIAVSPKGWVAVTHLNDGMLRVSLNADGRIADVPAVTVPLRRGNPLQFRDGTAGRRTALRATAAAIHPQTGEALVVHVTADPGSEEDFFAAQRAPVPVETASAGGYGGSTRGSGPVFEAPRRPLEPTVTATTGDGMGTVVTADDPVQDRLTSEPMHHLISQPSDIRHHPSWSLAFVTGYGSDNVLVLNTLAADPMHSPVAVISVGRAPQAIALAPEGDRAYVLNDFDFSVSEVDLRPLMEMRPAEAEVLGDAPPVPRRPSAGPEMDELFDDSPSERVSIDGVRTRPIRMRADRAVRFATDPWTAALRRGARVFTFARNDRMSHAGQFACASCHLEGMEDKLVWFISDGPRQTPALAGRLEGTAPFNWNGTKEVLSGNMIQTVERMGGDGLTGQEIADLESFLIDGLTAPKNPNLPSDGVLTPQQQWGAEIFNSPDTLCASCHRPGQDFTDGFIHNVGTANPAELEVWSMRMAQDPGADLPEPGRLNTPTLKGLFYTAPYLHDGSAATLQDVLDRTAQTMGRTAHLHADEKEALIAYLLTL